MRLHAIQVAQGDPGPGLAVVSQYLTAIPDTSNGMNYFSLF